MDSKPMSYDSIRTLLPHLEANKRIQLVSRVPYLRAMDKKLPLRLTSLKYGHDSITINGTEYKVGVIRHYPEIHQTPKNGRYFDFDKDGQKRNYLSKMAGSTDYIMEKFDFMENQRILSFEKQYELLEANFEKLQVLKAHGKFKSKNSKIKFWNFLKGLSIEEVRKKFGSPIKNQTELDKWRIELAKLQDFFQNYPRQDTPDHIKTENEDGGVAHDYDEYGFKILDSLGSDSQNSEDDLEMSDLEEEYEEAVRKYIATEKLKIFKPNGDFKSEELLMESLNYISEHSKQEVDEYYEEMIKLDRLLMDLKANVEKLHDDLQPFYNRKYSIPLEYTPYILLSVNGKPKEVVEYTKKLPCALRYLLFSNRKGPIQIKTLTVNQENVIRVPPGIKFKIRKLNLYGNPTVICESLKPIIHESSYPLEEVLTDDNEFHHKTIRTARKLVICSPVSLPNLLELPNEIVDIVRDTLSTEDYDELIESWRNNGKDIGTEWSFDVSDPISNDPISRALQMGRIPLGDWIGPTDRSIKLRNSAVLHISLHKEPTRYLSRSILKMVVKNV